MAEQNILLWEASPPPVISKSAKTPEEIAKHAILLRPKELKQILGAFSLEHYEMASTYVWARAMSVLRKRLATLGAAFIGEMLQRPDIESDSDLASSVTDLDAISLAEELGMISSTESMRLRNSHSAISHFSKFDFDGDEDAVLDAEMSPEEAILCLRATVQSILGKPKFNVAHDFAVFRKELEERTFEASDPKIETLKGSPYFFKKTTLSILLALLKTSSGAQLQHVVRNTSLIIKLFWSELRKSEKWQAGQTYAELFADGKKGAVTGLKQALSSVSGFDYVPETLRSSTFTRAANDILRAHTGTDNFYNEPAPVEALSKLGSTIPSPAFPVCMRAVLSVWLGNSYGHSWSAQSSARKILRSLSEERWVYYFDDVFPQDRSILHKLTSSKPAKRFIELVDGFDLVDVSFSNSTVKKLVRAGSKRDIVLINKLSERLFNKSLK